MSRRRQCSEDSVSLKLSAGATVESLSFRGPIRADGRRAGAGYRPQKAAPEVSEFGSMEWDWGGAKRRRNARPEWRVESRRARPDKTRSIMKSPTFVASMDAKRLCLLLESSYVGQLVTYKELSTAIGKDVQTEGRSILNSARRIVQRELSYVFGTVANQGLKRLSDVEIVQTGAQTVSSIRHASRRGINRIAAADPVRASDGFPHSDEHVPERVGNAAHFPSGETIEKVGAEGGPRGITTSAGHHPGCVQGSPLTKERSTLM